MSSFEPFEPFELCLAFLHDLTDTNRILPCRNLMHSDQYSIVTREIFGPEVHTETLAQNCKEQCTHWDASYQYPDALSRP